MGRRIHNLVSNVIVYIAITKNAYTTTLIINSAISHVLVLPYEFIESVHIKSSINLKGIKIDENPKKVREYIRKMIVEVIKSYIKKQYVINDFIVMKTDQKISLAEELTNWRTIFEALGLVVIKKSLPGKKDVERLAGALWGEKSLNDARNNYLLKNSPESKRKKTISEIKEHYTLHEFINSSIGILKEKKGMGWTVIASILGIKNNYGKLTIEKKYEIGNIVWNSKDVATIRSYNEYMERPEVKEDMIIHAMKDQYTLESFMSAQVKDLSRAKVKGYGWMAVCTILNIRSCNYKLSNEKKEAIACKVWGEENFADLMINNISLSKKVIS